MTNYILVGVGGTGTALAPALARYLMTRNEKSTLWLIDGDTVEATNLARQTFLPAMIGANKATAMAQILAGTDILTKDEYLGKKNIKAFIKERDIVLIAADNFPVRALIQKHAETMQNIVIINGGNEETDGSCQIFVRADGKNKTPPITHCHPEITAKGPDRAKMTCAQVADLPGGEQTIVANMMSAVQMLNMLRLYHDWLSGARENLEHELFFDLDTQRMVPQDNRGIEGWN